jgi:hypothetical protein
MASSTLWLDAHSKILDSLLFSAFINHIVSAFQIKKNSELLKWKKLY